MSDVEDIPLSEVPKADGMFEDVEWVDSDTISVVHTVGDRRFRLNASVFAAHEISEVDN